MPTIYEFELKNEGHPFYTHYVEAGKYSRYVALFEKAVAALNKFLPKGTWTFTIDGE